MREATKGECDGSGAVHKGGVGIVGGLGARRNATAAGGVTREDGRPGVDETVQGFKRCGALWSMSTTGGS
jgi:hypothetical protein